MSSADAAASTEPQPATGTGGEIGASEARAQPPTVREQPAGAAEDVAAVAAAAEAAAPPPLMSKNALKRLRRQQEWEAGKEDRRKRRREKRRDRKERRREERASTEVDGATKMKPPPPPPSTPVPVALIVDCGYDAHMSDKERTSLAGQVTRCYSDTRNARFRAHLWLAGWDGPLRERFRSVLGDQQSNWKGVGFVAGDFLACAEQARERMRERGGEMIEPLQRSLDAKAAGDGDDCELDGELDERYRDVVYLTSESPHTLTRLEPYTSYVVGGLVDKNREKGLCYRRARDRGVRTARLPIAQFMVLQSRQVLATNHVVEIMLKWLECEDWGQAFMAVIPKRKGGKLIDGEARVGTEDAQEHGDADDENCAHGSNAMEGHEGEAEAEEPYGLNEPQ